MKLKGLSNRFAPLLLKLRGKLPLSPWRSVAWSLDPRTLSAFPPPLQIETIEQNDARKKLRFDGRHDAWFPSQTEVTPEMWSEYLAVFWTHRANAHRYLADRLVIRPGDVCLDCGSCEGFFAMQALGAGAAQVICIEPSGEMADCLRQTFATQIAENRIIIRNSAVGAADGKATFSFDEGNPFGGALQDPDTTARKVKVETIATLCEELGLPRVDFIKIDIEGAEIQAAEGAIPILRKFHPRLAITTYHRSFHFAALRSLLMACGYPHIESVGNTDRGGGTFRPVMLRAWT